MSFPVSTIPGDGVRSETQWTNCANNVAVAAHYAKNQHIGVFGTVDTAGAVCPGCAILLG